MKWLLQTRLWSAFASSRSARLMFVSHCLRRSSLNFFVSSPWCNNIEGNRKNWNFPFSRFELWLQPNTAQRCGILIRKTDCETIPASAKHVRGYPPTWPTSGFLIYADVTCKQRIRLCFSRCHECASSKRNTNCRHWEYISASTVDKTL